MQYIAIARNVKMSPRKVRLVADSVRNVPVAVALSKLIVLNKRAGVPVKKAIESALANAVNNFKTDKNNLIIKELTVQEGISYKRYHFAARGRTRPYKRRTSHIRVILADREVKPLKTVKAEETIKLEAKTAVVEKPVKKEEKKGKEKK